MVGMSLRSSGGSPYSSQPNSGTGAAGLAGMGLRDGWTPAISSGESATEISHSCTLVFCM